MRTCISLASVTRSPHSLAGLQGTCICRIIHSHMYLASILTHCWTYHSLFFDVQVLTLLSEKYSLFSHENLCYPTTRLRSCFSIICTCTMGCKRSLTSHHTYRIKHVLLGNIVFMKPEDKWYCPRAYRAISLVLGLHKYNIAQNDMFYSVYYTESICFYLSFFHSKCIY